MILSGLSSHFTDTRDYYTAFNGGEEERVHLMASIVDFKNMQWKVAHCADFQAIDISQQS